MSHRHRKIIGKLSTTNGYEAINSAKISLRDKYFQRQKTCETFKLILSIHMHCWIKDACMTILFKKIRECTIFERKRIKNSLAKQIALQ